MGGGRKLATYVHATGPDGRVVVLGPDSDLPDWAEGAITNPSAWEQPDEGDDAGSDDAEAGAGGDAAERPPTSGSGSGVGAWRTYAAARGVEVPDGATRDEIVAAVDVADADGTAREVE